MIKSREEKKERERGAFWYFRSKAPPPLHIILNLVSTGVVP